MTTDRTKQILALKMRRGDSHSTQIFSELGRLQTLWTELSSHQAASLSNYVPMRLVTLIEVFVRDSIRALVDYDDRYVKSAEKLLKSVKFDYELVVGLVGRNITLGDLVAHSISTNQPDQIFATFANLDEDFVDKLKTGHTRWVEDEHDFPLPPIITDFDVMMETLGEMFEARHIVTHELPSSSPFNDNQIHEFFAATQELLDAMEWLVINLTVGTIPYSQTAMNIAGGRVVAALDDELAALLQVLHLRDDLRKEALETSQTKWKEYATAQAKFKASLVEGGSMYPMVFAAEKAALQRERIERLKWWANRTEGEI
jgi:hypothetical protein